MLGWVKRWLLRREVRRILERLDKGGYMHFLKAFFGGSKKATVVVGGVLLVVFRDALGLDDKTASDLVKLIMAYIGAQGVVDLGLGIVGKK